MEIGLNSLLGIMVVLIIGVAAVLPIVSQEITYATSSASVVNESMTCTNGTAQLLKNDNIVAGTTFTIVNATGFVIPSTNYTVTNNMGRVVFDMNKLYSGTSACGVTYSYWPNEYQDNSTVRNLMSIIPLFIVIGILLVAAYWIAGKG